MTTFHCEWCLSQERDAADRLIHKSHCCLAPVKHVPKIDPLPVSCSWCLDRYTGSRYQHEGECVYFRGCPTCGLRHYTAYHAKSCKERRQWLVEEDKRLDAKAKAKAESEDRNYLLSFRRPVTVSSVEIPGFEGKNAVDGNFGSRWSSQFSDPQWLIVNLEEVCLLSSIIISWEAAYAAEYDILVSLDGENYEVVAKQKHGKGGVESISFRELERKVYARYVKFLGIRRGTQWGYSIISFEVMGRTERMHKMENAPPKVDWSTKTPMEQVLGSDWWGKEVPQGLIKVVDTRKVVT